MSGDQIILFVLLAGVFGLLIWGGRWRYDLVAFSALMVALIAGVVPAEQAFSGFGHPATAIIALMLIVSRGLSNSGAIDMLARRIGEAAHSVSQHVARMAGVAAVLSPVMNNVAALALRMPIDIEVAAKASAAPRSR